jgi:HMG (high mobility group) box
VLGDKWKALSEKDRKPYEDKAKKDKERYEEEKIAYQNVCRLICRMEWIELTPSRRMKTRRNRLRLPSDLHLVAGRVQASI